MPYNPLVTDRSGEILASHIGGAFDAIGGAITGLAKQKEENKTISSQNKAIETLLKTSAPQLGINPEDLDKLLASSPDETPRDRNARLTTTLQGAMTTRELASRGLQDQAARMQLAGEEQRQQAALRNQRALKRATSGGTFNLDAYLANNGDDAQLIEALARATSPGKPVPGSKGFGRTQTPAGEVLQDLATGELVEPSKIIKPSAATSTGPEISADGRYQRTGPNDEWKPITERKNDEKALTPQELQQVQALSQSVRDLDALEQAYGSIGKKWNAATGQYEGETDKDWGGPVAGRLREWTSGGTDPNVSRIDNLVTSATPNLARGVFREVGVLTDEDIKRYRRLLPQVTDTAEQRAQKLADLRARLGVSTKETLSTLKAAGRDVAGLEEKLLPNTTPAPKPGEIPSYSSAAEVQKAAGAGVIKKGSMVRVGGKLYRVQ